MSVVHHGRRAFPLIILAFAILVPVLAYARVITSTSLTVSQPSLVGRSTAGAGTLQEITIGSGLSLSGGVLSNTGGGGGGVSDGDKGDITVSGSGATWTIDSGAVSFAKIQAATGPGVLGRAAGTSGALDLITCANGSVLQGIGGNLACTTIDGASLDSGTVPIAKLSNIATDRMLGRATAGSGAVEEITVTAAGRAILDDANAAAQRTTLSAAGSGAVGSSGITMSTARLLGRTTASTGAVEEITVGAGLSLSAGSLTASGGSDPWTYTTLTANHSNSTTTPTAIPTLAAVMSSATTRYAVECSVVTDAAATTTGVQITTVLTGTAPSLYTGRRTYCTTATALGALLQAGAAAWNATASAGAARCIEEWAFIATTGAGSVTLSFQLDSEVAASATTVYAGSYCRTRSL